MFYGLPIGGVLVGYGVARSITIEESGILIITALFVVLAFYTKYLIKKRYNLLREIDVNIRKKSDSL